jgi:hypothetical protein
LYPASTGQTSLSDDFGAKVIEPAFHLLIFMMFIFVDLLAASVLGLAEQWVVVCSVLLFLAYITSVVYFYWFAK